MNIIIYCFGHQIKQIIIMLIRIPKIKKAKGQNPTQTYQLSFYQKIRSNTFRQTVIRLNYQQQSSKTKITIDQDNKTNTIQTKSEKRRVSEDLFKLNTRIPKINLSQTLKIEDKQQKITSKFIHQEQSKYSLEIEKNLKKERKIIHQPPFRSYDIESFEKLEKNVVLPHMKKTLDIQKTPRINEDRYIQRHSNPPSSKFKEFLQQSPRVMFKNHKNNFDIKGLTSKMWTLKK